MKIETIYVYLGYQFRIVKKGKHKYVSVENPNLQFKNKIEAHKYVMSLCS